MKKTLQYVLMAVFALVLLTGCFGTIPTTPDVPEVVLIAPDDDALVDCIIAAPPARETYLNATEKEREAMLMALSGQQMKNTALCNVRFKELRAWKAQQKALYATKK